MKQKPEPRDLRDILDKLDKTAGVNSREAVVSQKIAKLRCQSIRNFDEKKEDKELNQSFYEDLVTLYAAHCGWVTRSNTKRK